MAGAVDRHRPGWTPTDVDRQPFCLLAHDLHPVRRDRRRAAGGTRPGELLLADAYLFVVLCALSVVDVSGSAVANLDVAHLEIVVPCMAGDPLDGESPVERMGPARSNPDRGNMRVATRGWNRHGNSVGRFARTLLVWRRGADALELPDAPDWNPT